MELCSNDIEETTAKIPARTKFRALCNLSELVEDDGDYDLIVDILGIGR